MNPPEASQPTARFGSFEVDFRAAELRKHGLRVRLQIQPFQILAMLLDRPGEVVTREELRQALWPSDTFVDFDHGLNNAINRLREALGDSAEGPRYVETLPRRGYRFIASVEQAAPMPAPATPGSPVETVAGAVPRHTVKSWILAAAMLGVAVALFLGLRATVWHQRAKATASAPLIQSLAVLPLENLSGDPAQEYFVDGMTDALITDLAQISSLKVISRTSVMRYKGTRKPLPEIAKELNVDGIVEGAVVRSAERVRVDAQLIEAGSDRHFWARSYERNLSDAVTLQNEVARAIANGIQVKLTPQEQASLVRTESVDPQAYELYLRARFFWNKWTDASVQKGIEYFLQAIQKAPNYALAYAGLADAYIARDDLSPEEQFSKAKAAARAALQMDDTLAEAHNALAMSLFLYDWDWTGAESEFQRALALNPNYALAHQWYGQYLRAMGRQNLAMAEIKRAQELDPLSLAIAGGGGRYGKQYDLRIEANRRKLELDPNFAGAYLQLGRAYALKGMYQEAIAAFQKGLDLSGGAPNYLSFLGYTYGVWGKRNEALKIVRQLEQLSKRRYVSPYAIALVYVGLDEKDLAFDWLQKAVAARSIALVHLKAGEEMASLRSDPRYTELKRRIGLPE